MYKSTEVYEMNNECNAKDELLRILGETSGLRPDFLIKCATITIKANNVRALQTFGQYEDPNPVVANLKVNKFKERRYNYQSSNAIDEFLDKLNVVYDCGYGGQELFGTVWLHDGTWLSREEYDGSEGWIHQKSPEIPEDLL
tara:strand:+ start:174 stop:599 length:426 start_codon:yes stop_codon:yes gene_type:complete